METGAIHCGERTKAFKSSKYTPSMTTIATVLTQSVARSHTESSVIAMSIPMRDHGGCEPTKPQHSIKVDTIASRARGDLRGLAKPKG